MSTKATDASPTDLHLFKLALAGGLSAIEKGEITPADSAGLFLVFLRSHEGRELKFIRSWVEEHVKGSFATLEQVETSWEAETLHAATKGMALGDMSSLLHRAKGASTDFTKAVATWSTLVQQRTPATATGAAAKGSKRGVAPKAPSAKGSTAANAESSDEPVAAE